MAYRLTITDGPADTLRRTAREELDDALERLSTQIGEDPVTAVHEARKDVKKTRALLRLARSGLRTKTYRRENAALRDAAGHLSGTRDADVLVATVDKLADHGVGRVPEAAFTALRERLVAAAEASRDGHGGGDVVTTAAGELRAVAARIDDWPLERCTWDTIVADTTRAYRRGRRELRRARRDPSVETLHEWRKRVKDLWYHQRLLADAWPEVLDASAEAAHALSEMLGDDHDLTVLVERLATDHAVTDGLTDLPEIASLAAHRRMDLITQGFQLGRRVYAESPKAFAKRLGGYVRAAARDAAAPRRP